jgi:PKD repeat protein
VTNKSKKNSSASEGDMKKTLSSLCSVLLGIFAVILFVAALHAPPEIQLAGKASSDYLVQTTEGRSLMQALTAARFGLQWREHAPGDGETGGGYVGISHEQNLNAWFAEDGVTVRPTLPEEKLDQGWSTALRLRAYGYGKELIDVPSIVSRQVKDNRIEYQRRGKKSEVGGQRLDPQLTEWYENRAEGIEQGFTLNERPERGPQIANSEALRLVLSLSGDLRAVEVDKGREIQLVDPKGKRALSYSKLIAKDANGKVLAARMEAKSEGREIALVVDDRGAAYPIVVDPVLWEQQIKLTASDGQPQDQFGARVAISGDTIAIGANKDDVDGKTDQGSVYVFTRNGATWEEQGHFSSSDGLAGDQFGAAVAIDGNTMVVGARYAENNYGKAYVFTRTGPSGTWIEQKLTRTLYPGSFASPGGFGYSVAISRDTIVVGNPSAHGINNVPTGVAHVFVRNGATWDPQPLFSGASPEGLFGYAVAVSGDTIIVGDPDAYFDTIDDAHPFGIVKGAAYVFTGSGANWSLQQQLAAPDGDDNDFFGQAVAIDGDSAIIGAPGDDIDGKLDQGSINIWVRSGTVWSQQFAWSEGAVGDNFGLNVAINGNKAIAAAPGRDVNGKVDQGAVSVFLRNGAIWSQVDTLTAQDGAAGDIFGVSVGMDSQRAIVGSLFAQSARGGVYVFESPDTDGDGLPDDWEINGITIDSNGIVTLGNTGNGVFINLPAMGADPEHKDIFVHADWMEPSPDGVGFKPNSRAIKMVIDAFAIAPVANPDGKPGINLHVDFGPTSIMNPVTGQTWDAQSKAGEVPYQAVLEDSPGTKSNWPAALDTVKALRFNPAKRSAVFHYALYCNRYGQGGKATGGGVSRGIDASDFILATGSVGFYPITEACYFMHELGHNLGLRHGGDEDVLYKPNYISIMNYRFDYIGILNGPGGREIDYSRRTLDTLDETHLDEAIGINDPEGHVTTWNSWPRVDDPGSLHNACVDNPDFFYRLFFPAMALDWNCDGAETTTPVSADINSDGRCVRSSRADGPLYTTPAGDDVVVGPFITSGPNRVCETTAVCGFDATGQQQCDIQDSAPGLLEPALLTGFNDWPALRFDGGGKIGTINRTTGTKGAQTIAFAETDTPPHELSTEEIEAEIPPGLIEEMRVAPSDVVAVSPQTGGSGSSFNFDGSGSTAVTGTIVSYVWNFGDGATGTGANVVHTYNAAGDYFATLTVTDSNGHVSLVPLLNRVTVPTSGQPGPTPTPTTTPGPTPAQGRYVFTKVIDSTQPFDGRLFSCGNPPQINDSRMLVFYSQVDNLEHNLVDLGYFRMAVGGSPTTIASFASGFTTQSQFGGSPFINASGVVSFTALNGPSASTDFGIFVGTGGTVTKIAGNTPSEPFLDFQNSGTWINGSGTVAFRAHLRSGGDGIFTGNGGAVATIADPSGFFTVDDPAMNESGVVVFSGGVVIGADAVRGIFSSTGGAITTVADATGEFSSFANPTINSGGAVAFRGFRDNNTEGVFIASGGKITTVADSSGSYQSFNPPQINDKGTVVFAASVKSDGSSGIFTGPDPLLNKVIAVGDALFGGTVTYVNFYRGLNNNNDIAFRYELDTKVDGIFVRGLAIASPRTVLANISTRMRVEEGDNVLIGGFIVTGSQPKKLMVRGIGPSLPVNGKLADPTLELHDSSGALIGSNDNWGDAPNRQEIVDSTIPPSDPLESAIVQSVAPGAYTAILRGANNTTGVGLVEVYDLDLTVDSKLANISTRGLVQTADNVMIGGFIIAGSVPQKVIVRAIGPTLPVDGKLADPMLELHDGNGAILEANDNWGDSPNKQAIIDSTIPPSNDLESAIVATLVPGNYTAIVRGVNETTGVALVEVYALN